MPLIANTTLLYTGRILLRCILVGTTSTVYSFSDSLNWVEPRRGGSGPVCCNFEKNPEPGDCELEQYVASQLEIVLILGAVQIDYFNDLFRVQLR